MDFQAGIAKNVHVHKNAKLWITRSCQNWLLDWCGRLSPKILHLFLPYTFIFLLRWEQNDFTLLQFHPLILLLLYTNYTVLVWNVFWCDFYQWYTRAFPLTEDYSLCIMKSNCSLPKTMISCTEENVMNIVLTLSKLNSYFKLFQTYLCL